MGLFWTKKKDAAYFRSMDRTEFFTDPVYGGENTSPFYSAAFQALPLETRRDIIAGKFGLSWAEYSKIPAYLTSEMMLAAGGEDNIAVAGRVADAAKQDARAARISGFMAAFKLNTGLILILAAAAAVVFLIYREPISKMLKGLKVRSG